MGSETKILLPKLGESIVSATVVQWFKNVGDRVERDEPLLEVSTDKVNSEIPSPSSGVLTQILAAVNQEVAVGAPLAILSSDAASPAATIQPRAPAPSPASSTDNAFLSPAVLRLLQEKGIPLAEIDRIPKTGEGGRLTKKDVEHYCSTRSGSCSRLGTERVPMTPLRKAIADNMVRSFYEAPHASLITEVDVTPIVQIIQEHKAAFHAQHGAKLSITPFVARALCQALAAYPLLNASLDGETILVKKFVNLGIAVSVDQGVMVPVIRGCDKLTLPQIASQIGELAEKARTGRLAPQDVQEGSITLTNFGMTGVQIGIPIIRHPEVAIVGLGAITKKVVPLPDDSIAIRSILTLSLTFDHRVLDGLYGCGFLNTLKQQLEHAQL